LIAVIAVTSTPPRQNRARRGPGLIAVIGKSKACRADLADD